MGRCWWVGPIHNLALYKCCMAHLQCQQPPHVMVCALWTSLLSPSNNGKKLDMPHQIFLQIAREK